MRACMYACECVRACVREWDNSSSDKNRMVWASEVSQGVPSLVARVLGAFH